MNPPISSINARNEARLIFDAALKAVDPYACVMKHMDDVRDSFEQGRFERVVVVAAGKGAYPMCRAAEESLGDLISGGIAVTKYGHGGKLGRIEIFEGGHPLPDVNGAQASEKIIELLKSAGEKSLVLCLLSGGGSALLVAPAETLSLGDIQKSTDLLLRGGADIQELNCVRKHLSKVKGGRLAEAAFPSPLISLILSDVIGDPLDIIASGPTSPDPTTFRDALDVIDKFVLREDIPPNVMNYLIERASGKLEDTPKPGGIVFSGVRNFIVGNNRIALEAARSKAGELGYETEIRSDRVSGDAVQVAFKMAEYAIERQSSLQSGGRLCVISGGETTVVVKGDGKGGRNMELALAFAGKIKGTQGITLLSAGTDGTDGPTDAAGAIVDGNTIINAAHAGYDSSEYLENNDSYNFFKNAEGLLKTGPTGTNVMDVQLMILEKS
ncbi:MAG: glycerate kinase [bacterium]|nr:glycerate kinase [bacterium]